jgi:hypothetical protein
MTPLTNGYATEMQDPTNKSIWSRDRLHAAFFIVSRHDLAPRLSSRSEKNASRSKFLLDLIGVR